MVYVSIAVDHELTVFHLFQVVFDLGAYFCRQGDPPAETLDVGSFLFQGIDDEAGYGCNEEFVDLARRGRVEKPVAAVETEYVPFLKGIDLDITAGDQTEKIAVGCKAEDQPGVVCRGRICDGFYRRLFYR